MLLAQTAVNGWGVRGQRRKTAYRQIVWEKAALKAHREKRGVEEKFSVHHGKSSCSMSLLQGHLILPYTAEQ